MKTIKIEVLKRKEISKINLRELRRKDHVPCVMYGSGKEVFFHAHKNNFRKIIYTDQLYLVEIDLEGQKHKCIFQSVQFDPVTDEIIHIDFIETQDNKKVNIKMPISFIGRAAGVRNGGRLLSRRRHLKINGLVKDIPDNFDLNIEDLEIGDYIYVRDVNILNCDILDPADSVIVGVRTARQAIEETVEAEEGEGEGEGGEGEGEGTGDSTESGTENKEEAKDETSEAKKE